MTFDEYQKLAMRTARDPKAKDELTHIVLGLMGEAGEIAEKFKKLVRDSDSDIAQLDKANMSKEIGDVLWYLAILANYLDLSFEDVATNNIAKLASRLERGKIGGSGDNR